MAGRRGRSAKKAAEPTEPQQQPQQPPQVVATPAASPAEPPAVAPPELPLGFVSPPLDAAAFKREAAAVAAAFRAAAAPPTAADTPEADLAALALDDVRMPTLQQAVRGLFESAQNGAAPAGDGGASGSADTDLSRQLEALFASPPPEVEAPLLCAPSPSLEEAAAGGAGQVTTVAVAAPPPPSAPDAAAARELREARHAALRAAPLQALRDVSVELAARRGERGAAAPAAKRLRASPPPPPPPAAAAASTSAAAGPSAELLEPDELIFRVALFSPLRKRDSVCVQELLALGSNTLAQLRDALTCPSDSTARRFGMAAPGAFLFIENVFYNDLRVPTATDLSAPLLAYAAAGPLEVAGEGPRRAGDGSADALRAARMEDTRLDALTWRLGKAYVYAHQGSCEHALRLRDVRRACGGDLRRRDAYPRCTYRTERMRRRCAVCEALTASKIVYGSRLAPESPCFFCDECFQRLHYSAEGRLLFSDFEVYAYE